MSLCLLGDRKPRKKTWCGLGLCLLGNRKPRKKHGLALLGAAWGSWLLPKKQKTRYGHLWGLPEDTKNKIKASLGLPGSLGLGSPLGSLQKAPKRNVL